MRDARRPDGSSGNLLLDFITFDRMLTGRVIHLVYWAGLGVIALIIFSVVGASAGLALGEGWQGLLLALPVLVAGLLVAGGLALLWRSFCEFYLAIFRISEDLAALRAAAQAGAPPPAANAAQPAAPAAPTEFRRYF